MNSNPGTSKSKRFDMSNGRLGLNIPLITAIAALIAAVMPVTAIINGSFNTRLERERHQDELRLKYLELATDPVRVEEYRKGILKYLIDATNEGDPLHSWAKAQHAGIEEREELNERFLKTKTELNKEKALRRESESNASVRAQRIIQLEKQADSLLTQLHRLGRETGISDSSRDSIRLSYSGELSYPLDHPTWCGNHNPPHLALSTGDLRKLEEKYGCKDWIVSSMIW